MATQCHVCGMRLSGQNDIGGATVFDCPRCGRWQTLPVRSGQPTTIQMELGDWDASSIRRRSNASSILRRQQRSDGGWVGLPLEELKNWPLDIEIPTPSAQADALVLFLGDRQLSHAIPVSVASPELAACIGAAIARDGQEHGLNWLLRQPDVKAFYESKAGSDGLLHLLLTMHGWARYEQLKHQRVESRLAFMAMQFGDPMLNSVVDACFRPAAQQAGFELKTLTDGQPAGCIDDQLRVSLRRSRFVIADLTHNNRGAYWEAGFAEGLGRPVIYSCRREEWANQQTHFDTNYLVTIIWDEAELADAAMRLKATIRATLPSEARMDD